MTPWTADEMHSFIDWHESVIAQYPPIIQSELRDARTKFLRGVKITDNGSEQ